MASTTTPKGITGGTLVALVAVAAVIGIATAAFQKPPTKDDSNKDEEVIVLSATFNPTPRSQPILVIAYAGDTKLAEELMTHSPWSLPVTVPKGAHVSMHVSQEEDGDVDCFIYKNGLQIDHNHRNDYGSIRCYYNRV